MTGPLHGIRVLDMSRILSGPFCTMLLNDLGAEVVKVERPVGGDPARSLGPIVGDDDSAYFISVNRGKKSMTLDISRKEGQELIHAIIPHFDVLVENFVPGAMLRYGLDSQSLRPLNRRLVYASISGFGQDGPEARRPALDIIVQAMGGIMSVTGEPGGRPVRPGASLGDSTAGAFTALAIVSALWQRERTGEGQHIDMSMLDCQITMMENAFSRYFATGQTPGPLGSRHPAATPFQAFRASDRDFVVALITDDRETWVRFCEAIGRPDLGQDERFLKNAGRTRHVEALAGILQEVFNRRPAADWLALLAAADIPCGPVNDIPAVVDDPQVKHRGMLTSVPHASRGSWTVANTPFRLSGGRTGPAGASPRLGEHTRQILRDLLGLSDTEIDSFKTSGVI
ncbi:MAG: CaiB/BaiF CoA-transferase family protein [Dehalococcoidia bacterium]|nr:CaiB/BaiF CoA-transferase family protein [Dehalococcoidia bacterium]